MSNNFPVPNHENTRPPLKDKDTHNTKIQPYLPGDDIWAFLERLGMFFTRTKVPVDDHYTICFDRLSQEALIEFTSSDTDDDKDRTYETLTRNLCIAFGPSDPATAFSTKLAASKQNKATAIEFAVSLFSTWKAYLLYLNTQDANIALPHDRQFIQFYLAGLNDEERMAIENANATENFNTFKGLKKYLNNRKTIWETMQRKFLLANNYDTPDTQPYRNLNMHPSRSNNMNKQNKEPQTNNQQSAEFLKFTESMTNTMSQFADTLSKSLNTMTSTINATFQQEGNESKLNYHGSTPDMRELNNHSSEHRSQYNSTPHHHYNEGRYNSRLYNHSSEMHDNDYNNRRHESSLNFHGGHNKHERSRSPYNPSRGRYQPQNNRSRSTSPLGGTNNCFGCGDELHLMIDCKELDDEEREVQCARIIYNKKMSTEEAIKFRTEHNLLNQPTNRASVARSRNPSTLNRGQPGYCHWCNSCGHYTINCTVYCVLCKKEGHGWRECTSVSKDIVTRRLRNLQPLIQSRAKQFGSRH